MARARLQVRAFIKTPVFITFIICLVLLAFSIVFVGKFRPFDSDDLYWQQVVRTWHPFGSHKLYLATKDIFIENVPVFWVLEHIFHQSRRLLVAETLILTGAAFSAFYWSSIYFLRKFKVRLSYLNLLPFVWLASFGYPLVSNYLNTDWRSFEIGFSFLTFVLYAAIIDKEFGPLASTKSKVLSILSAFVIGALIYSDPYYLFFTIAPIALFTALLWWHKRIDRTRGLTIFGGLILSYIFAKALAFLFAKAGVVIVTDTASDFVPFDSIVNNILAALHGLLIVFNGDFFGRAAARIGTIGAAINAAVLAFIAHRIYVACKHFAPKNLRRLNSPEIWVLFFCGTLAFMFIVYTSSTLVTDSNYRYFIIFVYGAITVLSLSIGLAKNQTTRRVLAALILAGAVYNIASLPGVVHAQTNASNNASNQANYTIIHVAEAMGLTKGYGSYWDGNINTYLSAGKVRVLPTICVTGRTAPFKWLIDGGLYNSSTQKSFFIIDPDWGAPPTCTTSQLIDQFGKPQKTIQIEDKTMLIYNYDISTRMAANWIAGDHVPGQ